MANFLYIIGVLTAASAVQSYRVTEAIAHLQSDTVSGTVTFTEQTDGQIRVVGEVSGLQPGAYGFHVHELGDPSDGCLASGAHFNPEGATHGGPEHEVRHVGDLGNVRFDADGVARIDFTDRLIALNGGNGVVGRALMLHAGEDDLGLGGHEDSLTTGNAGARVACGVIGIRQEVSAATLTSRPLGWCLFAIVCAILRMVY